MLKAMAFGSMLHTVKRVFSIERRGKGATGHKPKEELSLEEELKRAKAQIKLLEMANDSKKAKGTREAGESENTLSPSDSFALIDHTLRHHAVKGMTSYLCRLSGVSQSGYYRWLRAESKRQDKEAADEQDLKLIQGLFNALHKKAGALVIKMHLEQENGVLMNHKKIRRVMRKYGLFAKVRQTTPYKKMAKATQEHRTCPNLLQRQFNQGKPEKVLLTDITYIRTVTGNGDIFLV